MAYTKETVLVTPNGYWITIHKEPSGFFSLGTNERLYHALIADELGYGQWDNDVNELCKRAEAFATRHPELKMFDCKADALATRS